MTAKQLAVVRTALSCLKQDLKVRGPFSRCGISRQAVQGLINKLR